MMKAKLLVLLTILFATCTFSFTDKNADEELCLEQQTRYNYSELVLFEGYGTCGLLFRNVNTGVQFRVAKKPDDMYPVTGYRYYITRQLFEYSNEYCEMYEILTWSPASYYY